MRHFGITDIGLVRDLNEDSWRYVKLGAGHDIFIVSDGVGGCCAGEVASRIVTETLPALLDSRIFADTDIETLPSILQKCLVEISYSLLQQAREVPGFEGMAATVVCGMVVENALILGSMGDSRCYLLHQGRLRQLTIDHTVVQLLLDIGEITADQVTDHPAAGRLTQAVGMAQDPLPWVSVVNIEQGDRLLFCTDGLHGMIADAAISTLLASFPVLETVGGNLVQAALAAGGRDNVTAIIVDIQIQDGQA
jgi:PPM family protein phosphatase